MYAMCLDTCARSERAKRARSLYNIIVLHALPRDTNSTKQLLLCHTVYAD